MLRSVLSVLAVVVFTSFAIAQDQQAVRSMNATVSGSTVTVTWTPPKVWKNPDPAHQGYLVCAYVYEPGGSIWPRVVQLYFPVGTTLTCDVPMPPGMYMFQVFAHSDTWPDSIAKEKRVIVP